MWWILPTQALIYAVVGWIASRLPLEYSGVVLLVSWTVSLMSALVVSADRARWTACMASTAMGVASLAVALLVGAAGGRWDEPEKLGFLVLPFFFGVPAFIVTGFVHAIQAHVRKQDNATRTEQAWAGVRRALVISAIPALLSLPAFFELSDPAISTSRSRQRTPEYRQMRAAARTRAAWFAVTATGVGIVMAVGIGAAVGWRTESARLV